MKYHSFRNLTGYASLVSHTKKINRGLNKGNIAILDQQKAIRVKEIVRVQ